MDAKSGPPVVVGLEAQGVFRDGKIGHVEPLSVLLYVSLLLVEGKAAGVVPSRYICTSILSAVKAAFVAERLMSSVLLAPAYVTSLETP